MGRYRVLKGDQSTPSSKMNKLIDRLAGKTFPTPPSATQTSQAATQEESVEETIEEIEEVDPIETETKTAPDGTVLSSKKPLPDGEKGDDDEESGETGQRDNAAAPPEKVKAKTITKQQATIPRGASSRGHLTGTKPSKPSAIPNLDIVVSSNENGELKAKILRNANIRNLALEVLQKKIVKGQKGKGKGGALRHKKVLRDNIQGITKPAIRRLARRGGVKRINTGVYEETRGCLKVFLEHIIRDAITYTEHARRKTVTALDVIYALKKNGKMIYGFGG